MLKNYQSNVQSPSQKVKRTRQIIRYRATATLPAANKIMHSNRNSCELQYTKNIQRSELLYRGNERLLFAFNIQRNWFMRTISNVCNN